LRWFIELLLNGYAWASHPRVMWTYWRTIGDWPNAAFPRSFNEKVLWRKVFDRDPRFGRMTDKLAARDLVRERIPSINHPEILWVGDSPADLPEAILDIPCVLKTNRGSGWNMFNWSSGLLSKSEVVDYFERRSRRVFGAGIGEWPYRMVAQRYFAEELHVDESGRVPDDVKVHIFGGKVVMVTCIHDRFGDRAQVALTPELQSADTVWEDYRSDFEPVITDSHHQLVKYAVELARDIDYVRVDMYVHNGKIFFQEFTFFPGSGLSKRNQCRTEQQRNASWDLATSAYFSDSTSGWKKAYRRFLLDDLDLARAALDEKQHG
jgi:hypothetical protein